MGSERHLPPIRVRDDPGAENPPRSAPYREPVELACFSKSRDAGVTYDSSMLKPYARPSVPFDLSEGFDTFRDRDREVARPADLDPIFGALRAKGVEDKELAAADVVTWRGNFAKLLATPWNARDAWHMECESVHDVLVLNVLEPEESLAKERKRASDPAKHREKLMCYWGFSFEEACTGGFGSDPVDCADAFCAVVRAGVGRHRLVLGGEVDCWDGEKTGLPGYVELKTTRVMDAHAQVARFERDKLLKWWAQSFAVGVRRILVGFRDDDGFVRKLQTLDTLKLPGYAARHAGAWDPKTALAFADRVLTELKELFAGGGFAPGARVRLEYEPRRSREEVRVILDEAIPDFIPAQARRALARAAAIRAAGGGATSSGSRGGARSGSLSKSRGSGGGGSVAGGSGGGGSVGGPASFLAGGTAASAKRGVVFRAPDPKQPGYDPTKRSRDGGASGSGASGSDGSGRNENKVPESGGSLLSGDFSQDSSEKRDARKTNGGAFTREEKRDENAAATRGGTRKVFFRAKPARASSLREFEDAKKNASLFAVPSASGAPGSVSETRAGVSVTVPEGGGERLTASPPAVGSPGSPSRDAQTLVDPSGPAPAARFVHWGVGSADAARERSHERRRRRRHERSQTPVPGGAAPRTGSRAQAQDDASGRAGSISGGAGGGQPASRTAQPPPRAGSSSGGRFASSGGHKGGGGAHHSFRHPVVAGPGAGDPFKLAASKLAYARALGPAAMSFLMGFTPGDPGWRGDDAGAAAADEAAAFAGARGDETPRRVFSQQKVPVSGAGPRSGVSGIREDAEGSEGAGVGFGGRGEADRELDAGTPVAPVGGSGSPKKGSGSGEPASLGEPGDAATGSADEKKSVGLDPRAIAFDPSNPTSSSARAATVAARARDAGTAAAAERSGGSLPSNDGPRGSYVSAAVSGMTKRETSDARGVVDAFNADAAGSDVEDAEAAVKRTRRG